MAQRVARAGGELRHHLRQRLERALAGNQHVERRIGQQRQRELHPPPRIPARALRRGDAADLRRLERQPPRVKRLAERQRHRLVAVPAHLDDRRLERRRRAARARGPPASRWRESTTSAPSAARRPARRTGRRAPARSARARGLTSTSSTSQPGMRPASHATRQPTVPPPTTAMRSPICGLASQRPLIAVSRFAASTARGGGTLVGQHVHAPRGHDVARLMRIQHEHVRGPESSRGPRSTRRRWRSRTSPGRETRPPETARASAGTRSRHAAAEHERLGAAADAAVQRADDDIVGGRRRQRLGANLAAARRRDPERACVVCSTGCTRVNSVSLTGCALHIRRPLAPADAGGRRHALWPARRGRRRSRRCARLALPARRLVRGREPRATSAVVMLLSRHGPCGRIIRSRASARRTR